MLGPERVCAEVDPTSARPRTWHPMEGTPAAPVPPRATSSNSGAPEPPLVVLAAGDRGACLRFGSELALDAESHPDLADLRYIRSEAAFRTWHAPDPQRGLSLPGDLDYSPL